MYPIVKLRGGLFQVQQHHDYARSIIGLREHRSARSMQDLGFCQKRSGGAVVGFQNLAVTRFVAVTHHYWHFLGTGRVSGAYSEGTS